MGKLVFAFCDSDETYVGRFATFFKRNQQQFAEIMTFTNPEAFQKSQEKNLCLVWVLGDGFEKQKELAPDSVRVLLLGEVSAENTIEKYQSAKAVIKEILEKGKLKLAEQERRNELGVSSSAEVISVISSGSHPGQTAFSLALAKVIGKNRSVIYVNLSGCSGSKGILGGTGDYDISDLLYLCLETNQQIQIESYVNQEEDFSYISGAENPVIFYESDNDSYKRLLECLQNNQDYQVILVELGEMHPGFFPILQVSKQIINLRQTGIMDDYQAEEFYTLCQRIERQGGRSFLEHMQEIRFNVPANVSNGWQLVYGLMELAGEVYMET